MKKFYRISDNQLVALWAFTVLVVVPAGALLFSYFIMKVLGVW